jgi:hypothetical protein
VKDLTAQVHFDSVNFRHVPNAKPEKRFGRGRLTHDK